MPRQQSDREKALRKYFSKTNYKRIAWFVVVVLVGMVAVSAATEQPAAGVLLGLALAGGAIFLSFQRRTGKPGDAQVDAWLGESINDLKEESIKRLGLPITYNGGETRSNESLQTLALQGPIIWSRPGIDKDDIVFKKGDDGFVRFGTYRLVILHLTTHHLASYQCDYNLLRDVAVNVQTDEYPYEHIVTVSTREEASNYTLPTGVKMTHSEQFRISVSSGEAITVEINFPELRERTGGDLPDSGAQQAVNVIRARLRDRAAGAHDAVSGNPPI